MLDGLLVIDKPGGMTSREVVNRVQKWFPRKTKIGHAGTLDPLATGVLVVCVGAATRLADYVQAMGKSYASRFRLGATSSTDDADGEIVAMEGAAPPDLPRVEEAMADFVGMVEQQPPAYSALKVGGRRAHDLARRGREVPLAPRVVRIDAIRVQSYQWPLLDLEVDCGKGTYIRSIARDLGKKLGVGGLVETLRRTRIGPFTDTDSVSLDLSREEAQSRLLPPTAALAGLPPIRVSPGEATRLRQGQAIPLANSFADPTEVQILNEGGELFGVGLAQCDLRPQIVLMR